MSQENKIQAERILCETDGLQVLKRGTVGRNVALSAVEAALDAASPAAPVLAATAEVLTIPTAIMDLRCDASNCALGGAAAEMAYKMGHRDARHAAADLVLARADELKALATTEARQCEFPENGGEPYDVAVTFSAPPSMSQRDELPPLPAMLEPTHCVSGLPYGYTAEQMREYAKAALAAAQVPPVPAPTEQDAVRTEVERLRKIVSDAAPILREAKCPNTARHLEEVTGALMVLSGSTPEGAAS